MRWRGVSHVEFAVLDYAESIAFYDAMFGWLGYSSFSSLNMDYQSIYYMTRSAANPHSYIGIQPARTGTRLTHTDQAVGINHVALWARSRAEVDRFHRDFLSTRDIQVTDEPNTHEFSINTFGTNFLFKVQIRLGFRVNQRVNEYLYQIVEKLVADNMIAPQHHKYSIYKKKSSVGDFRFCLIRKVPSSSADISAFDRNIIMAKYLIRRFCGSPAHWYGLENSSVIFEYVPLFARTKRQHVLKYVELPDAVKRANKALEKANDEYLSQQSGNEAVLEEGGKLINSDEDEDVDLFDAAVRKAHDDEARYVEDSIIGGDTAVFHPIVLDDEDDDEEDSDN